MSHNVTHISGTLKEKENNVLLMDKRTDKWILIVVVRVLNFMAYIQLNFLTLVKVSSGVSQCDTYLRNIEGKKNNVLLMDKRTDKWFLIVVVMVLNFMGHIQLNVLTHVNGVIRFLII